MSTTTTTLEAMHAGDKDYDPRTNSQRRRLLPANQCQQLLPSPMTITTTTTGKNIAEEKTSTSGDQKANGDGMIARKYPLNRSERPRQKNCLVLLLVIWLMISSHDGEEFFVCSYFECLRPRLGKVQSML